ncbi:MAG: hypothetical protein M3Y86_02780, partial [Verrucomicrobiota bacterium]|nr:hypothetical protein [Verrucomicrobiota bacterium]
MKRCFILITIATGLISIASAARTPSAQNVQSSVRERIGQRVEWRKDAAADAEISQAVRALLRGTLTAERAVQIALLNNRELQATFEELGIANADLTEAGLLKNPVFDASAR